MSYPRLDIDCFKIYHNIQFLIHQLGLKNISVTPVTKVCLGEPIIAQIFVDVGAEMLADSRIENIQKMIRATISIPKMLVRTPMLSQVKSVVECCDISLNSEIQVIKNLSDSAKQCHINHGVIIMVELGDLREGVMPVDMMDFIRDILCFPNITIKGIGANFACRYGVSPDTKNMKLLSDLADETERIFDLKLNIISGGNSSSINWALNNTEQTRINNLRIGESIFLGCEPVYQEKIEGLFTDAITLSAEVIESKVKPSLPWGERGNNAFGEKEDALIDKGAVSQAILALGRQDVDVSGLEAPEGITIMSSSSDHLIVETTNEKPLAVGQIVQFQLDYSALLSSMSSEHIHKVFARC